MTAKKHNLTAELISSITNEQQVDKVYKINATSFNIAKIQSSIKKYNKLRCLILDFNYIEKIENINSLFDLRELHLEGNFVQRIGGLQTCKNITVLNLGSNKIQTIESINHLGKLQNLNLSKNQLQKITNLQSLKELKLLNLSSNKITTLNSLPNFSKLQTLLLNNNKIETIPANAFTTSSKLVRLDISYNQLSECSFISKLVNLETLNLSHNRLKSFVVDNQLKFLEEINLEHNELQQLPSLGDCFPELVVLNVNNNMFCSEHQFITMLSQSQMIAEIEFANNPIHSESFENTLFKVFSFDRINQKNFSQPGSKYLTEINSIETNVKVNYADIEDDQDDRKIRMSGFYNDDLQAKMTGIKPHRAVSPATKRARGIIGNDDLKDIAKNFHEFVENDKRIKSLRQMYQNICQQNNIQKPVIQPLSEDISGPFFTQQEGETLVKDQQSLSELRLRNDNNEKLMNAAKRQKSQKWSELKARTKQKSFNIRKSRAKEVNGSLSKVSTQLTRSNDLMKTQMVPNKFMSSKILQPQRKTANLFYRPNSQK